MKAKQISGVPQQKHGGFHDTESQKVFENSSIAVQKFEILKEKFFSVNQWKNYCSEKLADFQLYDSYGNHLSRKPEIGDFIRIDIPGPGDAEAKGYDWVKITSIFSEKEDSYEKIVMCCNPSYVPGQVKNFHIAHFYGAGATSSFMILREENYIKTAVYGRNERPNFNAAFLDKIRNIFIALGGILGIAKIQWRCLTDGLLEL